MLSDVPSIRVSGLLFRLSPDERWYCSTHSELHLDLNQIVELVDDEGVKRLAVVLGTGDDGLLQLEVHPW